MKTLRYVCAQPAIPYYTWQVEVMINNFMKMGINPNNMDIVCQKPLDNVDESWIKLANKYPCRFLFYKDTRQSKHYISSIRPNILRQHWEAFPELQDDIIFYHDCDIVFTQPPLNWIPQECLADDNWYGSDTKWYLGYEYIKGKGEDILNEMCKIIGLPEHVLRSKSETSQDIGAQYLMKNVDSSFWYSVEYYSEKLYKEISELSLTKASPDYHAIQIWTADMWALLWSAWKRNISTFANYNFNFSWGTSSEQEYFANNIMHNAGVTDSKNGLFYKAEFINELPYKKDLQITEKTASWHYWQWIQKAGENTCLLQDQYGSTGMG